MDYLALKRLITQQFQSDAELVLPSDLADLILSVKGPGTTVKCDGEESDPYAFLSVVDMTSNKDHPSIKALGSYALSKLKQADSTFHTALSTLLDEPLPTRLGFIFHERLINMPVQVVPPMYRLLVEELSNATGSPYTHFLFISRIYRLTADEQEALLATTSAPKRKKQKSNAPANGPTVNTGSGTFSFHPEDEYIQKAASHTVDYSFTNSQPREEKDAFGLDTGGRMMLVPAEKLSSFSEEILRVFSAPA